MEKKFTDLDLKPFDVIGNDWLLIMAEKGYDVNAMTASWGGFGVIWNKPVVYIFVRKSRFTKEFLDASETFSVGIFDHKKYKDMLNYMGTVSGRDEDKIAKADLSIERCDSTSYCEEAKISLLCKKLYSVDMPLENFVKDHDTDEIKEKFYPNGDTHTMYVGEVFEIMKS